MNTQTLSIQAASRHGPLPFALAALTVAVAALLASAAQAAEAANPWLVRAGLSQIAPKSGNGQLAVGNVPGLSFDATTAAVVVFRAQG